MLGLRPRLGPRLDWLCLQTSNQFNRLPCDMPRCQRARARLPTMQTEPSMILSTVGARNVRQTCVRASNLLMRHLLSPPCAARCQSSSSPIIIERFPTPAVCTCVGTDQNLISPPSMLRLSIWILREAYVVPSYIMRTMSYIMALHQPILINIPTDRSPLPRLLYRYHQVGTPPASPQAPEACFTRTSNCERQLPPAEQSPALNEP